MRHQLDPLSAVLRGAGALSRAAEFAFRRSDGAGDIYPDDQDHGQIPGVNPDQVLFLGEAGMMSLGVRTHALSLPAFSSRALARTSGRGVAWSSHTLPSSRIHDGADVATGLECPLIRTDAVVLLVGITDVLRVTSAPAWDRRLSTTLDALTEHLSSDTQILVAEIPPLDNAGSLSRPARLAAGIHGRVLNRRSRAVIDGRAGISMVSFPEELTHSLWKPESQEDRYTGTYRVWGAHLGRALASSTAS
jgi:hypothetical protein